MKNYVRKLIREELNKLFEISDFQSDSARQIATNMALFKLPRKGMDDSINYVDQMQFELGKQESEEEKEEDENNNFHVPAPAQMAPVSTNIYEIKSKIKDIVDKKVEESYGIYGSTQAAEDNLDWEQPTTQTTGQFSQDAQDEFDLHNGNIKRALKEVPPGNARVNGTINNKTTPWE